MWGCYKTLLARTELRVPSSASTCLGKALIWVYFLARQPSKKTGCWKGIKSEQGHLVALGAVDECYSLRLVLQKMDRNRCWRSTTCGYPLRHSYPIGLAPCVCQLLSQHRFHSKPTDYDLTSPPAASDNEPGTTSLNKRPGYTGY